MSNCTFNLLALTVFYNFKATKSRCLPHTYLFKYFENAVIIRNTSEMNLCRLMHVAQNTGYLGATWDTRAGKSIRSERITFWRRQTYEPAKNIWFNKSFDRPHFWGSESCILFRLFKDRQEFVIKIGTALKKSFQNPERANTDDMRKVSVMWINVYLKEKTRQYGNGNILTSIKLKCFHSLTAI